MLQLSSIYSLLWKHRENTLASCAKQMKTIHSTKIHPKKYSKCVKKIYTKEKITIFTNINCLYPSFWATSFFSVCVTVSFGCYRKTSAQTSGKEIWSTYNFPSEVQSMFKVFFLRIYLEINRIFEACWCKYASNHNSVALKLP